MREIATKKKPVFVQANSNSGQGHVLHYITSFCVVFRLSTLYFWLAGKTETKQVVNKMSKWVEGGSSWKGHESGQAVFIFLVASLLERLARQNCHATQAKIFTELIAIGKWTLSREVLQPLPFFSLRTSWWKLSLKKDILKCVKGLS